MNDKLKTIDYLIVGQGVAGTMLAHFLLKASKTIAVIDAPDQQAASKVAAGIINPVTGRRIVKSWRIDELLPFAVETYREIEAKFGVEIFTQKNILRSFDTNKQFQDWSIKSGREDMRDYISDECDTSHLNDLIKPKFAWGEIHSSGRTDLALLTSTYRDFFIGNNIFYEEKFDYNKIEFRDNELIYNEIKTTKIIFCEGWRSCFNPYFNDLPHEAAKGELLIIRIPDIQLDKMIKSGVFVVPIGDEKYWVGSTYEWYDLNDTPTQAARTDLIKRLEKILEVPYEILEHHAAVRPVFKHRRPVIGLHSEHPQLGVFNGLGTKGASIAPFWAAHFCRHLCEGIPLDEEVNVGLLTK